MTPRGSDALPALVGVVHLEPLPGSPRFAGDMSAVAAHAAEDARLLDAAGFDAVMVENFGDAPFCPGEVEAVTIAAIGRCALEIRQGAPELGLGINVLRNDARAALGIAAACGAQMIRVNVHVGARLTDQGVLEGRAHDSLRLRRALGLHQGPGRVALLCDVAVKHSAALAPRPLAEEAEETAARGLADALVVTGSTTGRGADPRAVEEVLGAASVPLLIGSGVTHASVGEVMAARAAGRVHGIIVGSCLRRSGRAGDRIDGDRAQAFAEAFWAARG
jgi:hypothetical protein